MQASALYTVMEQLNKAQHEVDSIKQQGKAKAAHHCHINLHQGKKKTPSLTVRLLRIYSSHSLKKLIDTDSLFYLLRWQIFLYLPAFSSLHWQSLLQGVLVLSESRRSFNYNCQPRRRQQQQAPSRHTNKISSPSLGKAWDNETLKVTHEPDPKSSEARRDQ